MTEPTMVGRDFPQLWWLAQQHAPAWGGLVGIAAADPELARWIRVGWVSEVENGFVLTATGHLAIEAHSKTPAGLTTIASHRKRYVPSPPNRHSR